MFYFRFLAAGTAISAYGRFLNMVALSLFAYQVTGSALHTGLFMALRLGSGFLAGFPAGAVVARLPRKRLMIAANLVQATAMAVLFIAPAAAAGVLLYLVAIVMGAAGTLTAVALRTSVPEIVGAGQRVRANGQLTIGRSVAMLAGFASSGLLIAWGGYPVAFAVNAGTFVLSALILATLPIRTSAATSEDKPSLLTSHRTALAFLAASPVLLGLLVVRTTVGFGAAAANVSIPIHASTLDPGSPETFMAQFWTVWAIGNIGAQLALGRYSKRTGRAAGQWVFVAGACVMSAAAVVVFTTLPLPVVLAAALVTGAASGVAENTYHSRLQDTPDAQRGYLFGLSLTAENLSFGVGMVAAATLLDTVGPLPIVTAISGITIVAALMFSAILLHGKGHKRDPVVVEEHA